MRARWLYAPVTVTDSNALCKVRPISKCVMLLEEARLQMRERASRGRRSEAGLCAPASPGLPQRATQATLDHHTRAGTTFFRQFIRSSNRAPNNPAYLSVLPLAAIPSSVSRFPAHQFFTMLPTRCDSDSPPRNWHSRDRRFRFPDAHAALRPTDHAKNEAEMG